MKSRAGKNHNPILPPPAANGGDEFPPFLKAKDISDKGTTQIALLGDVRKSSSQFAEGIDIGCKIGNKKYTWTIKYDSGNYRRLYERFGPKEWKGAVKVERKTYMSREYVAVTD